MENSFKESRDEQDECSAGDTQHADLLLELNKSVSRLRALSTAEYGDTSAAHLEHTLDAILNMAQKNTFDESTAVESLRVARPVQKRKVKEAGRFCMLRLLLCGRNENKDNVLPVFPDQPSRLGSRSRESFWKEGRPVETTEHRQSGWLQDEDHSAACDDASKGSSTNSKKNLVVTVGGKHEDDISSLNSDLFVRKSFAYDTSPVVVSGSPPESPCIRPYENLFSCRTQHPQLPLDEGHLNFFDLITCQRSLLERRERLRDQSQSFQDDRNRITIVGVRKKSGDSPSTHTDGTSQAKS